MTPETERGRGRFNVGGVGAGLIVLTLGVLMLLDRSGWARYELMRYFPGLVLVALGLANLTSVWCDKGRRRPLGGLWLLMIGGWLIVSEARPFGFTYYHTWPLLLIGVGILILLGALFPRPPVTVKKDEDLR